MFIATLKLMDHSFPHIKNNVWTTKKTHIILMKEVKKLCFHWPKLLLLLEGSDQGKNSPLFWFFDELVR